MAMYCNRARPEAEVEKVYRIKGTGMSFSASQTHFDYKAAEKLSEIRKMRRDGVEVCDDLSEIVPEKNQGDLLFLSSDRESWLRFIYGQGTPPPEDGWRTYGSILGHGIPSVDGHYRALKRTYVYYKGNQKTNWFMNAYNVIDKNTIQIGDIILCHVFQSDGNYDPRPKLVPTFSAFDQEVLNSSAEELEALIKNTNAFMDFDECDENVGAHLTWIANGSGKKRSNVWKDFTEIKVLAPDGVVVLTLAICHGCYIAYKTGSMEKSGFKNYGTKTLKKHTLKHHIAGNPKEAPHN